MHISKLATVIVAAMLLTGISAYAQEREMPTIADENGCKVYNPMPQEEESINWNGTCSNGYAHGTGILDWYVGGELEERYEGELKQGWRMAREHILRDAACAMRAAGKKACRKEKAPYRILTAAFTRASGKKENHMAGAHFAHLTVKR